MPSPELLERGATGVISHHVRAGKLEGYEKWLQEIGAACRSYHGHVDFQIVRPIKNLTNNFTIIIRFDTHKHLHDWITSDDRKRLIEKAKYFLVKDVYEIRSGLDFWFMPKSAHAPKRWRQFLITRSAIYPLGILIPALLTPTIHKLGLPENHYFTYLIFSGVLVFLMAYLVMPRYTKLVKHWLFRSMKQIRIGFLALLLLSGICSVIKAEDEASQISIPINPLTELDYKTKAEIYVIRKAAVAQHTEIWKSIKVAWLPKKIRRGAEKFLKPYEPNPKIFGHIEDGKPWWGLLGIVYYGPGQNSILGLSEESRFINNPYLLVGLDYPTAFVVPIQRNLKKIYPKPYWLSWDKNLKSAKVKYNISALWREEIGYHYENQASVNRKLEMIAYNADDFGLQYLYVVPEKSKNMTSGNPTTSPVLLRQFLHSGGSCGYRGGCNNMSPITPELSITIAALPARAVIAMWQKMPESVNQEPDMTFTIEMI